MESNPNLYDIISCRGVWFVFATATPLELMIWATNIGYRLEIDDDGEIKLWTRNAKPMMDYFAYPQHDDYLEGWPRDEATELARWM